MRHLIFLLFAATAAAQSVGDFSIPYKASSTGPQTLKTWAKVNSTLWGTDPSGNPQSIALASGLSLSAGILSGPDLSGYQLLISDGDLTIARTSGLQTALDGKQPMSDNLNTLAAGFGAIATGLVKWNGASGFVLLSSGLPTNSGGTGQTAYTTGDLLYGSAGTLAVLAGNTTTTKKYLSQTGTGLGSAAPIWSTIATSDLVGTISNAQLANSSITINGSAVSLGGSTTISTGLTIGTTTISGGTDTYILYNNAGTVGNLAATGTGSVVRATSPTLFDKITLNKTGQTEAGGMEVADDPAVGSVRALFLLPPANNDRLYLGKSGQGIYAVNFSNVTYLESVPRFDTVSGFTVGGMGNTSITRGAGGTEIGANNPGDYGLDIHHSASYDAGTDADIVANIHRVNGITFYGAHSTRSNWEGVHLYWTGTNYAIDTTAGGTGTVRDLVLSIGGTVKAKLTSGGVSIGASGSAIAQIKRYSLTLVAGTATVSDTDITASTHIIPTVITPGGTVGTLDFDVSAGSSFTINSSSATDTSNITVTVIIY